MSRRRSRFWRRLERHVVWPIAAAVLLMVIGILVLTWLGILWPEPMKPPL